MLLAVLLLTVGASFGEEQCEGKPPVKSLETYKGMVLDYDTADHICCNNHRWAERFGYAFEKPERDLFSRLDRHGLTVFYDSVCGLPLFVAPKGRTFEEFEHESVHHGWPSFRPAELVSENVIIHSGGRMESKCGTHLGHNLPMGGVDRYCIDLVCIAGPDPVDGGSSPAPANTNTSDAADTNTSDAADDGGSERDGTIEAEHFDPENYNSSASLWSDKHPITATTIALYVVLGCSCLAVVVVAFRMAKSSRARASTGFSAKLAVPGDEADATNKAVATGAITMT